MLIDLNDTRKLDQIKAMEPLKLSSENRNWYQREKDKLLTNLKKNNCENIVIIAIVLLWLIIEYLLRFSD